MNLGAPPLLRFTHAGGNSGLASFLLEVFELLLGIFEGLLLVGDLLLVLRVLLVPVTGVAQAIAGIGIEGGGADLIFALEDIEFALQQIDLIFLRRNLLLPLFKLCLTRGFFFRGFRNRRRRWSFSFRRRFGCFLTRLCLAGILRGRRRGRGRAYDRKLVFGRQIVVVEDFRLRLGLRVFANLPRVVSE